MFCSATVFLIFNNIFMGESFSVGGQMGRSQRLDANDSGQIPRGQMGRAIIKRTNIHDGVTISDNDNLPLQMKVNQDALDSARDEWGLDDEAPTVMPKMRPRIEREGTTKRVSDQNRRKYVAVDPKVEKILDKSVKKFNKESEDKEVVIKNSSRKVLPPSLRPGYTTGIQKTLTTFPDIADAFKIYCAQKRRPMKHLASQALEEFMKKHP